MCACITAVKLKHLQGEDSTFSSKPVWNAQEIEKLGCNEWAGRLKYGKWNISRNAKLRQSFTKAENYKYVSGKTQEENNDMRLKIPDKRGSWYLLNVKYNISIPITLKFFSEKHVKDLKGFVFGEWKNGRAETRD